MTTTVQALYEALANISEYMGPDTTAPQLFKMIFIEKHRRKVPKNVSRTISPKQKHAYTDWTTSEPHLPRLNHHIQTQIRLFSHLPLPFFSSSLIQALLPPPLFLHHSSSTLLEAFLKDQTLH